MSIIYTEQGLEKMKSELKEIKEIKLKEVAVRIKDAKDLGDLSENAEYHEAKNEQAFLYGRALELEKKIKEGTVIQKSSGGSTVYAGCHVKVENEGDVMDFELVGSEESDPLNGRISIDSPIGSALSGHDKGEEVSVFAPGGETKYKILSIE